MIINHSLQMFLVGDLNITAINLVGLPPVTKPAPALTEEASVARWVAKVKLHRLTISQATILNIKDDIGHSRGFIVQIK